MADKWGMRDINVILHVFTLENLKMTQYISHTKMDEAKDKKAPSGLHSRITWEIYEQMQNFYTQSKWLPSTQGFVHETLD